MRDMKVEMEKLIAEHGHKNVLSVMAKWLAERKNLVILGSDPYGVGRRFARGNRENIMDLLLFRQGLIDEILNRDHTKGMKLLTKKGRVKHADETKKQHQKQD